MARGKLSKAFATLGVAGLLAVGGTAASSVATAAPAEASTCWVQKSGSKLITGCDRPAIIDWKCTFSGKTFSHTTSGPGNFDFPHNCNFVRGLLITPL